MKYIGFLVLIVFWSQWSTGQIGKKVQFIGGARSLLSHSNFNSESDTVTAPKSTGGYALLDLGFRINPNASTEILGMVRIKNAFGGFWGGGVSFDVRQLYVRGVAGNFLRYQIGNIDYKLTPYTFYNHNQDVLSSSIGTMKIKEDVANYESFYKDHTWRQQGASVNFGLQFPKLIQQVEFNGFITRLNPTDFQNVLERLYGGGNMVVTQSKYLKLGLNHVGIFDLEGTALDSNIYHNNVSSLTYDLQFKREKFTYGIDGESGISVTKQKLYPEKDLTDYFIHARAYFNIHRSKLNLDLGYMDNGPDFRSFGAQSKRINFNQENSFYNRYTNAQMLRSVSMYDVYNDPNLYNQGITARVMDYNPVINNVLPYGIASFNRRGGYIGISHKDKREIIVSNAKVHYLSEIRGQGTSFLKSFLMGSVNGIFHAHKLWKGKKEFNAQLGLTYQKTMRNGDFSFESVNLESILINLGIEYELIDQLYVMGNLFTIRAQGIDQKPVRDADDQIINYEKYEVKGNEMNISGGLRFDFSEKIYLAAMYEWNTNKFNTEHPYTFKQFSIFYVMKF